MLNHNINLNFYSRQLMIACFVWITSYNNYTQSCEDYWFDFVTFNWDFLRTI